MYPNNEGMYLRSNLYSKKSYMYPGKGALYDKNNKKNKNNINYCEDIQSDDEYEENLNGNQYSKDSPLRQTSPYNENYFRNYNNYSPIIYDQNSPSYMDKSGIRKSVEYRQRPEENEYYIQTNYQVRNNIRPIDSNIYYGSMYESDHRTPVTEDNYSKNIYNKPKQPKYNNIITSKIHDAKYIDKGDGKKNEKKVIKPTKIIQSSYLFKKKNDDYFKNLNHKKGGKIDLDSESINNMIQKKNQKEINNYSTKYIDSIIKIQATWRRKAVWKIYDMYSKLEILIYYLSLAYNKDYRFNIYCFLDRLYKYNKKKDNDEVNSFDEEPMESDEEKDFQKFTKAKEKAEETTPRHIKTTTGSIKAKKTKFQNNHDYLTISPDDKIIRNNNLYTPIQDYDDIYNDRGKKTSFSQSMNSDNSKYFFDNEKPCGRHTLLKRKFNSFSPFFYTGRASRGNDNDTSKNGISQDLELKNIEEEIHTRYINNFRENLRMDNNTEITFNPDNSRNILRQNNNRPNLNRNNMMTSREGNFEIKSEYYYVETIEGEDDEMDVKKSNQKKDEVKPTQFDNEKTVLSKEEEFNIKSKNKNDFKVIQKNELSIIPKSNITKKKFKIEQSKFEIIDKKDDKKKSNKITSIIKNDEFKIKGDMRKWRNLQDLNPSKGKQFYIKRNIKNETRKNLVLCSKNSELKIIDKNNKVKKFDTMQPIQSNIFNIIKKKQQLKFSKGLVESKTNNINIDGNKKETENVGVQIEPFREIKITTKRIIKKQKIIGNKKFLSYKADSINSFHINSSYSNQRKKVVLLQDSNNRLTIKKVKSPKNEKIFTNLNASPTEKFDIPNCTKVQKVQETSDEIAKKPKILEKIQNDSINILGKTKTGKNEIAIANTNEISIIKKIEKPKKKKMKEEETEIDNELTNIIPEQNNKFDILNSLSKKTKLQNSFKELNISNIGNQSIIGKQKTKVEFGNSKTESIIIQSKPKILKEEETQIDLKLTSKLSLDNKDKLSYGPYKPKKPDNLIVKNNAIYINNDKKEFKELDVCPSETLFVVKYEEFEDNKEEFKSCKEQQMELKGNISQSLVEKKVKEEIKEEKSKILDKSKDKLFTIIKVVKLKNAISKNTLNKKYFIQQLKGIQKNDKDKKNFRSIVKTLSHNYLINKIKKHFDIEKRNDIEIIEEKKLIELNSEKKEQFTIPNVKKNINLNDKMEIEKNELNFAPTKKESINLDSQNDLEKSFLSSFTNKTDINGSEPMKVFKITTKKIVKRQILKKNDKKYEKVNTEAFSLEQNITKNNETPTTIKKKKKKKKKKSKFIKLEISQKNNFEIFGKKTANDCDRTFRIEKFKSLFRIYITKNLYTLRYICLKKWKNIHDKELSHKKDDKLKNFFLKYTKLFTNKTSEILQKCGTKKLMEQPMKNEISKNYISNKLTGEDEKQRLNRKKIGLDKINSLLRKASGKYLFKIYKQDK